MKILKDFILDFWRELFFGFLILACIFLVLGYQSRGEKISVLESENQELRNNKESIVDATTKQDLDTTTIDTVDETEVGANTTTPQSDYTGFDIVENETWVFSEGDEVSGYSFVNGSQTVDVKINPSEAEKVVGSDIIWSFDIDENSDSKEKSINLTDTNEVFCVSGQANCTFGDGRLQVLVNQGATEAGQSALQFFFTDTVYVQGGDSFNSLKEFLKLIEVQ